MKNAIGILFALMFVLNVAGAQQQKVNDEDKCCCSTFETGQCLIGVTKKVDDELNTDVELAVRRWTEPSIRASLKKAQETWTMYREENCQAEMDTYSGGSIAPNMYGFCRIRLTRQRIAEIKNIYLPER